MKLSKKIFSLCLLTTLSFSSAWPYTDENTPQSTVSSTNQTLPSSLKETWKSIQNSTKKIEDYITSTNFTSVHEWQEKLSADLAYLKTNSSQVMGEQAKRWETALKQASVISSNLYETANKKLAEPAKRELEKLKNTLKSIEPQFSENILSDSNQVIQTETPRNSHYATKTIQSLLKAGEKIDITLQLKEKEGTPISLQDLKEVHTQKIHLLIIDSSLIDYHHVHPVSTKNPGEYQFSFTPQKPGSYRIWADITPKKTDQQVYVIADLPAETQDQAITDRMPSLSTQVDDLKFELSFDQPNLKIGKAALGKLKITDKNGEVITQLEPVMDTYAHIVGFNEDYQIITHIHPMGSEPTKESDRGRGELTFHLLPKKPGLIRLFTQIRTNGEDKFARFTLFVPAESD